MNTTTDYQEAEKAQALLRFALGNHNAKRYNEAAGLYEVILKRYPDTEAAQFAKTNLDDLIKKINGLEMVQPDEILITRIEQSTGPEPIPNPAASTATTRLIKPESKPSASFAEPDPASLKSIAAAPVPPSNTTQVPKPSSTPIKKRLRITENPYLLAGLFFLTAVVSYFIGREHVKYEIRQAFTGAAEGFRKGMAEAMAPLKNLDQSPASTPTQPKVKPDANKPKVLTFPVKLNSKNLTEVGYRKTIDFRITIDNPMDRSIKAFEGRILFKDVLGKLILGANLSYRDGIAANGSATWAGEIEYNQFIDRHREISNIDIDKLLTELEVYKVAYEDGTIEEFPKP